MSITYNFHNKCRLYYISFARVDWSDFMFRVTQNRLEIIDEIDEGDSPNTLNQLRWREDKSHSDSSNS